MRVILFFLVIFTLLNAHSKEVLFRSATLDRSKYEKIVFERNGVLPLQYFLETAKNKEVSYSQIDECLKKSDRFPDCQTEILKFLETTLNVEERENLKALLQDLISIKKFKRAFVYSSSLLKSLNERKRSQPILSLRGRGAIAMVEKSKALNDLQILRNGLPVSKENLFWFEDEFSQWTLVFSTQPPKIFTGYLKQVFDALEAELLAPKKTCQELRGLFTHPNLPPQFEVVGLSNCEIKRDLLALTPLSQRLSPEGSLSSGNRKLLYFAGGLVTTLLLLEYLKDKKIVISSSF